VLKWLAGIIGKPKAKSGHTDRLTHPSLKWKKGDVVLEDYVYLGKLGEGGMGDVSLFSSRTTGVKFAVKTLRLAEDESDESIRHDFLAELQVWIDLPEHPNLTACRFFRTYRGQLLIFSEYVDGGSLADWVDRGDLFKDGSRNALVRIHDIAIQTAWGLSTLHRLGLVHQDFKPPNVLLTKQGDAKITDFGLSRARRLLRDRVSSEVVPASTVSCRGQTEAYCSPEQVKADRLTRKTDIWSWGITTMEMFTIDLGWKSGLEAPRFLEEMLRGGEKTIKCPMPEGLAAILRKCLRINPMERWHSMDEIARALIVSYRDTLGEDYPRARPPFPDTQSQEVAALALSRGPYPWPDPTRWLEEALKESGRDPSEAAKIRPPRFGYRRARAVADMAAYEEAYRLMEDLVASGRGELEHRISLLCLDKALLLRSLEDISGALEQYDMAIEILGRLAHQGESHDLPRELGDALLKKASALQDHDRHREAIPLLGKAIETFGQLTRATGDVKDSVDLARAEISLGNSHEQLREYRMALAEYDNAKQLLSRLVFAEDNWALAQDLGRLFASEGTIYWLLGDFSAASSFFDKAIGIFEEITRRADKNDAHTELARICLSKGNTLTRLGDYANALVFYKRATDTYEMLVGQRDHQELSGDLAAAYVGTAIAHRNAGEKHAALESCDRAIGIYERLVSQEGRFELGKDLGRAYLNKANALANAADVDMALELYDRAARMFEQLVIEEGRTELEDALSLVYVNKANILSEKGLHTLAEEVLGRAIEIRERLVRDNGRAELRGDLAWARMARAKVILALGDRERAAADAKAAGAELRAEIARTGRADLKRMLTWAEDNLKELLGGEKKPG